MGTPIFAPQQARKDINGMLIESLATPGAPSLVSRIATEIQSTSDVEQLGWLGDVPAPVDFAGQLQHKQLTEAVVDDTDGVANTYGAGYAVVNRTRELTLCVSRDNWEDQKTGGLTQRVNDMAARIQQDPDNMLISKLVLGATATGTCYLGTATTPEYAFSATHAARGAQTATWSNLYTRSGTTTATAQADISGALTYLYTIPDEANLPANGSLSSLFILYPPAMRQWIREAVQAGVVSNTSNVQFSGENIQLIMCPQLAATHASNYYIGFNDPGVVRGLIYSNRQAPSVEQIGPGSDTWTDLRQTVHTVNHRGAAAFGKVQRLVYVYSA
jgi:hypothetical protein